MSKGHETVQVQIPPAEPTEEKETQVYTAADDMLIANVVYTPANDISGDWDRPRYMQLRVGMFNESEGQYIADASAQTSDFYLPANVGQNAELVWTNRLYVRKGETLYWSSHIVRPTFDDGIPDPGGIVEILLEPANVDESSPAELVPDFWQGKILGIEYRLSEVPHSSGTVYHSDHVGRLVEATESGIALEAETPHILGKERETYEFAYERIMHIRLL
jgi:hypothetical protein